MMNSFSRAASHPSHLLLGVAGVTALLIGERSVGAFLLLIGLFHAWLGVARARAGHTLTRRHVPSWIGTLDLLWIALLLSVLVYLNVHWLFMREHVEAGFITYGDPDSHHAVTLALTIISICLMVVFIQKRSGEQSIFTFRQFHGYTLFLAVFWTLFILANVIYNPWLAPALRTTALGLVDWGYVAASVLAFTAVREFGIHSKKHSRKAVLALHAAKHSKK